MIKEQEILKNPEKYGYVPIETKPIIKKNSVAIYSNYPHPNHIYTCYYVWTEEDDFQPEGIAITFTLDNVTTNIDVEKFV